MMSGETKRGYILSEELDAQRVHVEAALPQHSVPEAGTYCYCTYIADPSNFYIRTLAESDDNSYELCEQILQNMNNTNMYFGDKKELFLTGESYFAGYVEEYGGWYRVQVLDWGTLETELISVRLVDYGDEIQIESYCMCPLKTELTAAKVAAHRCHISSVEPVGGEDGKWTSSAIEFFKSLMNNIVFTIDIAELEGDSIAVDLAMETGSTVLEQLVKLGYARISEKVEKMLNSDSMGAMANKLEEVPMFITDSDMIRQIKTAQGLCDPLNEYGFEYEDDEDVDPDSIVQGYVSKDEGRVCRFMRADGTCFKGDNCTLLHIKLRKDGWTTDKKETFCNAKTELALPRAGSSNKVRVYNVVDLKTFYVHIKKKAGEPADVPMSYKRLLENIQSDFSKSVLKRMEVYPALGEIVLVRYDDIWYRGRVIDVNGDMVEVFFVDYGGVTSTSLSEMRCIEERYLVVPFQAVMCRLWNVVPKEQVDQRKASQGLQWLIEKTIGQKLTVRVMNSCEDHLDVLLYDLQGCDIGEMLIHMDLVLENTGGLCPKEIQILD